MQNSNSPYKSKNLQNLNSPEIREHKLVNPNSSEQNKSKGFQNSKYPEKRAHICKARIRPDTNVWIIQCMLTQLDAKDATELLIFT